LGHSSLNVTMKYARHKVDLFPESAYQSLPVDFGGAPAGKVLSGTFSGAIEAQCPGGGAAFTGKAASIRNR